MHSTNYYFKAKNSLPIYLLFILDQMIIFYATFFSTTRLAVCNISTRFRMFLKKTRQLGMKSVPNAVILVMKFTGKTESLELTPSDFLAFFFFKTVHEI